MDITIEVSYLLSLGLQKVNNFVSNVLINYNLLLIILLEN